MKSNDKKKWLRFGLSIILLLIFILIGKCIANNIDKIGYMVQFIVGHVLFFWLVMNFFFLAGCLYKLLEDLLGDIDDDH